MVFEHNRKSCGTAPGSTEDGFAEMDLRCAFCGAPARLEGRWSRAKVVCTECGQELPASTYEDQIEAWKDKVCRQLSSL